MAKESLKFEAMLAELQAVVDKLEEGKAGLDEALSLYERGTELVRLCNEKLEKAEQKLLVVRPEAAKKEGDA